MRHPAPTSTDRSESGISRRRLLQFAAAGAGLVPFVPSPDQVAAQDTVANEIETLLLISQRLCGGGTLQPSRAPQLLSMISEDRELLWGVNELAEALGNDQLPVEGGETVPGHRQAQDCAAAILAYWYAAEWQGDATPDRATAYYGNVAWQAMYTSVWAVCRSFGNWTAEPGTTSIVPSN